MNKYRWLLFVLFINAGCSNLPEDKPSDGPTIALTWELLQNGYAGKDLFKAILTFTNKGSQRLDNKDWELYFNHTFCREIITDSLPPSIKIVHLNGDFYKLVPTERFQPLEEGKSLIIPILSTYAATKYSDAPGGFYFVFKDPSTKEELIKEVSEYTIVPFTKEEQIHRNGNDKFPVATALTIFNENEKLRFLDEKEIGKIIPTPVYLNLLPDSLEINSSFEIHFEKSLKQEADFLATLLEETSGLLLKKIESDEKGAKVILLKKQSLFFTQKEEGYSLQINQKEGIIISGNHSAGIFYGIQSLRALFPIREKKQRAVSIPVGEVNDYPEFEYRGMLLDVSRNFQTKKNVLKLIDLLSFYKLNKLALQVADDEGWRLEIPGLPELTEVGGKRGHTTIEQDRLIPSYGSGPYGTVTSNGFYSKKEYIEIVRYAHERHIEIIPQIDLPGHARAAIKAMDVRYARYKAEGNEKEATKYFLRDVNDSSVYKSVQKFNDNVICPCQDGVYNFVSHIAKEISAMHEQAGAPLSTLHLGGDEVPEGVWTKSKRCEAFRKEKNLKEVHALKQYFFDRMFRILNDQKLVAAAYEDVKLEYLKEKQKTEKDQTDKKGLLLYSWNNVWGWGNEESSYRLANDGFPMVLGHVTNLYLDLAYTNAPDDPGQYWGGFNDTRKGFEYTPYFIYNSAYRDVDGNSIDENRLKGKQQLTKKGKSCIKGMQSFLFSETLKDSLTMDYFIFPKILGMAERSWAKMPDWAQEENKKKRLALLEKDWNRFANTIGRRELPRLDQWRESVDYYLPAPGAKIQEGYLIANVAFPGLTIRYTTDGSVPDKNASVYKGPLSLSKGTIRLASFSSTGRKSSITSLVY